MRLLHYLLVVLLVPDSSPRPHPLLRPYQPQEVRAFIFLFEEAKELTALPPSPLPSLRIRPTPQYKGHGIQVRKR